MSEPTPPCKRAAQAARPGASPLLLDPATPAGAALRTTVASVIAMALAFAMHVEVPALAVVFVLARGNAGAISMVLGSLAGSAAALVLLALFDQSRAAFSVALFALTALTTYAALGHRFPYAFIQAQLSFLVLVGQGLDTPDVVVRHAFYQLANVLIAAFAAFVAGASQPVAIASQLQDALVTTLRGAATLLDAGSDRAAAIVLRLELLLRKLRVLRAASWPTRQVSRARHRVLRVAVDEAASVVAHVLAIAALARSAPHAARREEMRALRDAIESLAPRLGARRGPLANDLAAQRAAARALALAVRRAPHGSQDGDVVIAGGAASARRVLARLAMLAPFLRPGVGAAPESGDAAAAAPRPHPPLDRYRLRHALKSAAAYEIVLWAWVAANWGAIVPALVVSVLVATLATPLGATFAKAVLRVGGVLVGGGTGLLVAVLLLPYITSLPAICVVSGLALFGFLLLQRRHERYAFAALQAAIAFTLTLVHGTAPSPTWRAPLDSVIGLAFGISVVVLTMHAVWPIDAATSAHRVLAGLLARSGRRLALLLAAPGGPGRQREAAAVLAHEDAAAQHDAERAAGFAHEVALYGAQFGQPREHLAELLRLVVELDALVAALAGPLRPPAHLVPAQLAGGLAQLGALLEQACRAVAAELASLPGASVGPDAAALLDELQGLSGALAARDGGGVAEVRHAIRIVAAATALLADVRRELASPAHAATRSRAA